MPVCRKGGDLVMKEACIGGDLLSSVPWPAGCLLLRAGYLEKGMRRDVLMVVQSPGLQPLPA
jgi:hypothetical protein